MEDQNSNQMHLYLQLGNVLLYCCLINVCKAVFNEDSDGLNDAGMEVKKWQTCVSFQSAYTSLYPNTLIMYYGR